MPMQNLSSDGRHQREVDALVGTPVGRVITDLEFELHELVRLGEQENFLGTAVELFPGLADAYVLVRRLNQRIRDGEL
jgi:hypothetical protein